MDYPDNTGAWVPDSPVVSGPPAQAGQAPAPGDAWLGAVLGSAIGVYVDRVVNSPQTLSNNTGYGMGANGQLYQIGQPVGTVTTTVGTAKPAASPMMLLLVLGVVLLAVHH